MSERKSSKVGFVDKVVNEKTMKTATLSAKEHPAHSNHLKLVHEDFSCPPNFISSSSNSNPLPTMSKGDTSNLTSFL